MVFANMDIIFCKQVIVNTHYINVTDSGRYEIKSLPRLWSMDVVYDKLYAHGFVRNGSVCTPTSLFW